MKIGIAQLDYTIGDFTGNAEKILSAYRELCAQGAELVVASELALFGYPPKDLLELSDKVAAQDRALQKLSAEIGEVGLVIGVAQKNDDALGKPLFNAAVLIRAGKIVGTARKSLLPTYDVFDESRYFEPERNAPVLFDVNGKSLAILICEDIWNGNYRVDPVAGVAELKPDLLVVVNASPYHWGKGKTRFDLVSGVAKKVGCPVVYANQVGGNDDLIFDGRSFVVNKTGECVGAARSFEEESVIFDTENVAGSGQYIFDQDATGKNDEGELYRALVLGVRDYLKKTGNKKAVIAESGGIDSALTTCIAVDALGAENVMAVGMPSAFSSEGSVADARKLAENLGVKFVTVPIGGLYEAFGEAVKKVLGWRAPEEFGKDVTEENVQARMRGAVIMAFSNRNGALVLTTGNKSEIAVGYCTLYGDMVGGLGVISDVPKTIVYQLSRYVNRSKEIIPNAIIEKAPSAELRPGQKDQDSLPPYEILDAILRLYIEEQLSWQDIVARGFDEAVVRPVISKIDRNEYKRRQSPVGLKVTSLAFGFGRRYPIARRLD